MVKLLQRRRLKKLLLREKVTDLLFKFFLGTKSKKKSDNEVNKKDADSKKNKKPKKK